MNKPTLLTPADPVLLIADPQPGLAFVVESQSRVVLENNLLALAKTAVAFKIPVVLTTSATAKVSGPVFPALASALGGIVPIERTTMNAWEEPKVVQAVKASGRQTLLVAGLLTEACVAFTALSALAEETDVRVVVDSCGASSHTAHETSVSLMMQAGMVPRTWLQLLLELQRDWTRRETYVPATDIVRQHAGAYGIVLDYTRAMLGHPSA
jgi:nicotinamidase-related amidase